MQVRALRNEKTGLAGGEGAWRKEKLPRWEELKFGKRTCDKVGAEKNPVERKAKGSAQNSPGIPSRKWRLSVDIRGDINGSKGTSAACDIFWSALAIDESVEKKPKQTKPKPVAWGNGHDSSNSTHSESVLCWVFLGGGKKYHKVPWTTGINVPECLMEWKATKNSGLEIQTDLGFWLGIFYWCSFSNKKQKDQLNGI